MIQVNGRCLSESSVSSRCVMTDRRRIPYPAISLSPPEAPVDDNASLKGGAESIRSVSSTATARTKRKAGWTVPGITDIKIEFEKSSDNQGRVTVYGVEILTAA